MAGSTNKKIVVFRFERDPAYGFVNPLTYLAAAGIEMISVSGALVTLAYSEVKAVCFARDFDSAPAWKANRAFASRPKMEGLWVRLKFRDGDTTEGLMQNNLALIEERGFQVTTPDQGTQNRAFIPRAALTEVQVLGVIGSPLRRPKVKPAAPGQLTMFE